MLNTDTTIKAEGRFLRMKSVGGWEFAQRTNPGGVVAIIGVTAQDELILTEQFRPPVGKNVMDLPAGLIGDEKDFTNEDACEAARRELIEECGYAARHYSRLFDRPTSPGLTDEVVSFVHAENLKHIAAGGGVGNEKIKVHKIPLTDIHRWVRQKENEGCLIDPKIDVALSYIGRRIISEKQDIHLNAPLISRDKIRGMMLGLALGDALGCPVEFADAERIKNTYGRVTDFVEPIAGNIHGLNGGQFSDDTQLTIAVMSAIIDSHGFNMNKIAEAHVKASEISTEGWGGTTKEAVEKLKRGVPWEKSGHSFVDGRGVGNGVAMKIAPLAALISESNIDDETELKIITAFTKMSHPNNLAVASAMAQCRALTYCLKSDPESFSAEQFTEEVTAAAEKAKEALPLTRSAEPLIERLGGLKNASNMTDADIIKACNGGSCYVADSIPQTLMFFLRNFGNVLPLFDTVNAGGDTDTNASMAGALLGALHGESIFPSELLNKVDRIDEIRKLADKFCDNFGVD